MRIVMKYLMETSEYGNTDLNSIISGDKNFAFESRNEFAENGFIEQEVNEENGEFENVDDSDMDADFDAFDADDDF